MIKIGIIGTGSISHEHMQSYVNHPEVELYALCDLNLERAQAAAKKYGVDSSRVFTDMNDMLALDELDAVSVCTWNSAHAPCTIAALNAGKHVLCEKPMALNATEAKEMKQAADKAGKLLQIGFVRRYGNDCAILKDFISKDFFGEIYYAKAAYLRRNGNPGGWFGDKTYSGGGPLIDLGVHVIDLVRYLLGNPKPVSVYGATFQKLFNRPTVKASTEYSSAGKTENDVCNVEDLASAMIRFENGAVLSIEASFSLNLKQDKGEIELFGTKAGAKISPELQVYTELNDYMVNVDFTNETALSFGGLFQNEINHFVDNVSGKSDTCIAPAEDGIELMRILDGIYESARTGHEVILEA